MPSRAGWPRRSAGPCSCPGASAPRPSRGAGRRRAPGSMGWHSAGWTWPRLDASTIRRRGAARGGAGGPAGGLRRRDFSVNALALGWRPIASAAPRSPGRQADVRRRTASGAPPPSVRRGSYAGSPGGALRQPSRLPAGRGDPRGDPAGGGAARLCRPLGPAAVARDRAGGGRAAGPPGLRATREMEGHKPLEYRRRFIPPPGGRGAARALGEVGGLGGGPGRAFPPRAHPRPAAEMVERGLDRLALAGEPRARIEAGRVAGPLARPSRGAAAAASAVGELLEGARSGRARGLAPRGARARRRIHGT